MGTRTTAPVKPVRLTGEDLASPPQDVEESHVPGKATIKKASLIDQFNRGFGPHNWRNGFADIRIVMDSIQEGTDRHGNTTLKRACAVTCKGWIEIDVQGGTVRREAIGTGLQVRLQHGDTNNAVTNAIKAAETNAFRTAATYLGTRYGSTLSQSDLKTVKRQAWERFSAMIDEAADAATIERIVDLAEETANTYPEPMEFENWNRDLRAKATAQIAGITGDAASAASPPARAAGSDSADPPPADPQAPPEADAGTATDQTAATARSPAATPDAGAGSQANGGNGSQGQNSDGDGDGGKPLSPHVRDVLTATADLIKAAPDSEAIEEHLQKAALSVGRWTMAGEPADKLRTLHEWLLGIATKRSQLIGANETYTLPADGQDS